MGGRTLLCNLSVLWIYIFSKNNGCSVWHIVSKLVGIRVVHSVKSLQTLKMCLICVPNGFCDWTVGSRRLLYFQKCAMGFPIGLSASEAFLLFISFLIGYRPAFTYEFTWAWMANTLIFCLILSDITMYSYCLATSIVTTYAYVLPIPTDSYPLLPNPTNLMV